MLGRENIGRGTRVSSKYQHDEERIESLVAEVASLTERRDEAVIASEQATTGQHQREGEFEEWQHRWNEFTQLVTTPIKDQEVQRSRIEQLESADAKAQERLARLDGEIGALLSEEERLEVDTARSIVLQGEADLAEAEVQVSKSMALIAQTQSIKVSRLARGVPAGGELEYMDANTLNQAFSDRRTLVKHIEGNS